MRRRSPLYLLEAFGFSPWVLWRIRRGGLDEVCSGCGGAGIVIDSPCRNREPGPFSGDCTREAGCKKCRRECPKCRGRKLPDAAVHAEDFGGDADRALALLLDPSLDIDERPRVDRRPQVFGER